MKRISIILALFFVLHPTFAEKHEIFMDYHRVTNSKKNLAVNRSLIHLPISVAYDENSQCIDIKADISIKACVYIYDDMGVLVGYSSLLNSHFYVADNKDYVIKIEHTDWYAYGKFKLKSSELL